MVDKLTISVIKKLNDRMKLSAYSHVLKKQCLVLYPTQMDITLVSPRFISFVNNGTRYGIKFDRSNDIDHFVNSVSDPDSLQSALNITDEEMMPYLKINYFEYLPDEVLVHIFSNLNPSNIQDVLSVCYQWYDILNDKMVKKRIIKNRSGNITAWELTQMSHNLKHVEIEEEPDNTYIYDPFPRRPYYIDLESDSADSWSSDSDW